MSRELRERLEDAQGRVKSLRDCLPSMSEPSPLPEDLTRLEQLSLELTHLEQQRATAAERTALVRAARDEADRAVLRLEPQGSLAHSGIPVAMASGLIAGVALTTWWVDLGARWPRFSLALSLGASAVVLLRGAWRSGRISGARGPG